jgi:hypothetical protein
VPTVTRARSRLGCGAARRAATQTAGMARRRALWVGVWDGQSRCGAGEVGGVGGEHSPGRAGRGPPGLLHSLGWAGLRVLQVARCAPAAARCVVRREVRRVASGDGVSRAGPSRAAAPSHRDRPPGPGLPDRRARGTRWAGWRLGVGPCASPPLRMSPRASRRRTEPARPAAPTRIRPPSPGPCPRVLSPGRPGRTGPAGQGARAPLRSGRGPAEADSE